MHFEGKKEGETRSNSFRFGSHSASASGASRYSGGLHSVGSWWIVMPSRVISYPPHSPTRLLYMVLTMVPMAIVPTPGQNLAMVRPSISCSTTWPRTTSVGFASSASRW